MANPGYKNIGKASTLGELRALIDEAIKISGADAQWNGFDDGNIYVHPKSGQWIIIECKGTED